MRLDMMLRVAIILLIFAVIITSYVLYMKREGIAMGKDFENQVKTEKFVGVIKEMRMGCYLTGYCEILLEPNISILAGYNPGDASPEILKAQEGIWGELIGFEVGKEKEYIGRKVEVYAEDKSWLLDSNYRRYTLKGNKSYYIKLLP